MLERVGVGREADDRAGDRQVRDGPEGAWGEGQRLRLAPPHPGHQEHDAREQHLQGRRCQHVLFSPAPPRVAGTDRPPDACDLRRHDTAQK